MMKKMADYGAWCPTITAEMLTKNARRFGTLKTQNNKLFWCEGRSDEQGRGVLMQWHPDEGLKERLPKPFSARSTVHEYGGGEFCVAEDCLYFVNAADQQIYRLIDEQTPEKITNTSHFRFADLEYDHKNNRLIAVAERHARQQEAHSFPKNMLVYIGLQDEETGGMTILSDSHDFYASPRLSPDQTTLVWLQWNLPHMPWEAASLYYSPMDETAFTPSHIAGGFGQETQTLSASFGPHWSSDGTLYYINDKTGTGQLYNWKNQTIKEIPFQDKEADGLKPLWVFGMEGVCSLSDETLIMCSHRSGELVLKQISDKEIGVITSKAKSIEMLQPFQDHVAAIITTDQRPPHIALINPSTGDVKTIRESLELKLDQSDISKGQLLHFEGPLGKVYGLYYPPQNAEFTAEKGQLPPVIITVHGGPTAMSDRGLKLKTQYWTNRGYAVFEIDYSGSSGYGKAYRERLNGNWGTADVDDILAGTSYLIEQKLADQDKLIISGGSAGGYTALMALVNKNIFKCASVSYPVTDLGQLLKITHKFEAGYTYSLTGTTPKTASEQLTSKAVTAKGNEITTPVIFFQGLEDKVVPPSQPKAVYERLRETGVMTKLFEFEGEGHGFRNAKTITSVLREEEKFYKEILEIK